MEFTNLLTDSIHGDNSVNNEIDIAPPIHVTTTFEYNKDPDQLYPAGSGQSPELAYSREVTHNSVRVEEVLSKILGGHAVSYSSGLSAFHALLILLVPKRLFIGDGYHGVHQVAEIFQRVSKMEILPLSLVEQKAEHGDLVHLETPVNPTGLALDLKSIAKLAHAKQALVSVDATFAPPPLFDPFKFGADYIMHSATKYLGGHSDTLSGVLVVKTKEVANKLILDRMGLGTIIPSLEAWSLLRSLKTFPLRIRQQSENAKKLVEFLNLHSKEMPKLVKILSSNLQTEEFVKEQLPLGGSPCFSILVQSEEFAKQLPSKLKYFYHATSLGSVHSLVEWRKMSDEHVDGRLLRFSIGCEDVNDLITDLANALK